MHSVGTGERALGTGALAGLLGLHLPVLGDLPQDVRSLLWGAIGAGASVVIAKGAKALAAVVEAWGRRVARRIDPAGAAQVEAAQVAAGGGV